MDRRAFLATAGSFLAFPLAGEAQQAGKVYRIGFLWDTPAVWPHALRAFREGLRDLGWIEGQNLVIEYRWAEGRFERLPGMVEELLRLKVDLIVAPTSIYTGAVRRLTSTVPIVFASHADPIGSGHVTGLARPGTNATGLTIVMRETMAKSVELLKAALPGLGRLAVIYDPATPSHRPGLKAVQDAGRALGLQIRDVRVGTWPSLIAPLRTLPKSGPVRCSCSRRRCLWEVRSGSRNSAWRTNCQRCSDPASTCRRGGS